MPDERRGLPPPKDFVPPGHFGGDKPRRSSSAADMFNTTRWSLIAAAADPADPAAKDALADLCRAYWRPVFGYVCRREPDRHKAEDLTQAFFARLLEANDLAAADPARGRFRSFLLAACQHFLANQYEAGRARKRGGGRLHFDFTAHDPPAAADPPEKAFERQWATELLSHALAELRQEYADSGRAKLFDALKDTLTGDAGGYAAVAAGLGMTEGAVKVAVFRLRQRYRDRLREAIARTVADPADVDDEVRDLFAALG